MTIRPPWLPLGLLTLTAIALLLSPIPLDSLSSRWQALVEELENLGHPFLFGLLAHFCFRLLRAQWPAPSRAPYAGVLIAAVALGLTTEVIQHLIGRDASWVDLANDLLGASFLLLIHARLDDPPLRWAGWGVACVAVLTIGPFLWTVAAYVHRSIQAPTLWLSNSPLFHRFSQLQRGAYPGLFFHEPLADWSGYNTLVIELHNLRDMESSVRVRVHDQGRNHSFVNSYNQTFELAPGSESILRISLDQIRQAPSGREMDMTAISGIIVFQMDSNQAPFFSVDEIRLER